MKRTKLISGLVAMLLAGCLAQSARAQFIGYVSPQTVQQTLASSVSCTGSAQNFVVQNLGQTFHQFSVTPNSSTVSLFAIVQGIDVAGNTFQISDTLQTTGAPTMTQTLTAAAYYPIVRIQVFCSGSGAAFSISYAGASATPQPFNGATAATANTKLLFSGIAAGSSFGTQTILTPYGQMGGVLEFNFRAAAGPAGSTLTVQCTNLNVTTPTFTFALITTGALQSFYIPAYPCPALVVIYTSGGASVAVADAQYVFYSQGEQPPVSAAGLLAPLNGGSIAEKGPRWGAQTSAPGAGSQATTSKSAGTNNTRHVADCVTWSAGASTAPAATTLTINLRDGATGTGTILWQTQVTAAATAAQHGQSHTCGLNLIGSTNTAMTLEFAAGLTNESEAVALTGYDVQ